MAIQTLCIANRGEIAVRVINTCRQGTLDGKIRSVRGRARLVDKTTGAKLKVTFFWPFWGAYWIIALDADYQWAVVGHPDRTYLWILSRSPQMDSSLYDKLLEAIAAQGYDLSTLEKTLQPLEEMPTAKEEA